ncbi:DEAD-domain-containing protein [Hypoxylon trugodes]|uniref:DEAD-domain-containing protein n=1 Tax=Hypoxylon trugodes TaxID=326681 RepID=UPI00219A0583|nr:DEAD-domain-containing protein [Hypoxylon trugodes]KAI1392423.1 DEAD-domain-containing protein [Hypoxylon trugodes]
MSDWGVADMKAALPEQAAEAPKRPDKPVGDWGEPVANDYTETDTDRVWGSNTAVYEWNRSDEDEGDVGPESPELELQLFGPPETRATAGIDFSKIAGIEVIQEGIERISPIFSFKEAGLHPVMLKNVEMAGYAIPTPIQRYCVPAIKMGYDIIAVAQTGSGKTAAYLVPILNHLMGKVKQLAAWRPSPLALNAGEAQPVRAEPLVLVMCPTRELAVQIFDEARKFCYRTMLRPCVVYGGGPLRDQIQQIGRGCDLLIATPGRLIDIMGRPGLLTLRRLKFMVMDEADELLDTDWSDDFERIFSGGEQESGDVNYMLFSATFPAPVRRVAKEHLAINHIRIRVGRIGSTHANIKQDVVYVKQELKREALLDLLYSMKPGRTIIFVNSKRIADEIDDFLFNKNFPCTSMHADRTQREREDAMRAFRAGKSPLLVTTGVSARGIDVRNVLHVINYDLPSTSHGGIQEYIHRIGRTARIGYRGTATSFYTERDEPLAESLTKILMETQQPVPDFLQQYVPEGVDPNDFKIEDDHSDEEGDDGWDDAPKVGVKQSTLLWVDGKATVLDDPETTEAVTPKDGPGSPDKAETWGSAPKAPLEQTKPAADSFGSGGNAGGMDWGSQAPSNAYNPDDFAW